MIPEFIMTAVKYPVAIAKLEARIESMRGLGLLKRLRKVLHKFGL